MGHLNNENTLIVLIHCPDSKGLISKISSFFFQRGFNILRCQQYSSPEGYYFMRLIIDLNSTEFEYQVLLEQFDFLAQELSLHYSCSPSQKLQRTAIFVTKAAPCLYDLLFRHANGELRCEIPIVIGNHPDLAPVADMFQVPFVHVPVTKDNKEESEQEILEILRRERIELVVLARYMQVLSPEFIAEYKNRIINIHHAMLPAFQGARPYERAYTRGVKVIGATAHYATEILDDGPIIEQDVQRVDHEASLDDLKRLGADIERIVLARAVQAHLENRITIFQDKTVVF